MTREPRPRAAELDDLTLHRAQRGERAACRDLITHHQAAVHALLHRILEPSGCGDAVEDLAQETFLRALGALPRFSPAGPARLSTWILTIAARLAIDEARRRARWRPLERRGVEAPPAPARPDEEAQRGATEAAVRRALASLSPEHRAVLVLRAYHDLDYPEIAHVLQLDLGTVKSRLSRARAALREALAEMEHG